jgi:P4 family phage/plasmid primase-like protien
MFHYLMYFLATCLDNRPKDSIFLILQGAGCNGKSSLLELAKTVLGKYGAKVSMATLTDQKRTTASSANEQMMAFHRARLAFYSETNKQEEINCAIVKEYTSQESITARGIYQKQRTFRPKCNHVITTNFYPVIKTTDYGIWRRMKLYKFKITFVPREPENKYERKADERVAKEFAYNEKIKEAFLSLLIEYYKDLQKTHGGKLSNVKSKSLEKDSLEYRNSMDTLNRFMCCSVVYSKDCKTLLNEVVEAYINFLVEEYGKQTNIQKNEIKQLIQNSDMNTYISGNVLNNIRLIDPTDTEDKLSKDERFLTGKTVKIEEDTFDYSTMDPLGLNSWISTA